MLALPDVTLVAIFTVAHELSRAAIAECTSRVDFGDVRIFTDKPESSREVRIDPFRTLLGAGEFTTYRVPAYIGTRHALFIHWDSWVVHPEAWRPQFLDYDYVGAPWWYRDAFNVGNSGFCLRSKALIDFLAAHPLEFPLGMPEDHVLCRHYQSRLPQFRWAPDTLAWRFSFERTAMYPPSQVFGFHGVFNWPHVMGPEALAARVALAQRDPYASADNEFRLVARRVAA